MYPWRVMKIKLLLLSTLVSCAVTSQAALVIFSGNDSGANSTDPRPNSNAAAAAFDLAATGLGPVNLITFESAPLGTFSSLVVATGVTLTGSDFGSADQTIRNTSVSTPDALWGYNTTPGGSQFASFNGGTMTFTFATPVRSFGAYFGGVQDFGVTSTIKFNDGTSQTMNFVQIGSAGGVQFLGFTDAGKSISSITIDHTNDVVSMDDVRYGAVPEPASIAAIGLGVTCLLRRRRKVA